MSMGDIINQMESLAAHCESMIDKDDPESIWKEDVVSKSWREKSGEKMQQMLFGRSWRKRM